ncbi:MAG: group II intron reverse transcriptase/maturase, partial [Candidatus Dormibacteraceae bacterium]
MDDLFAHDWQELMADENARKRRKKRGDGNWRLVRYADDWVALVTGAREHAVALRQRAAGVLAS